MFHAGEPQVREAVISEGRVTLGVPVLDEPYQFIISVERSLQKVLWNWNKGGNNYELERIREVEQDLEINRFNDGKCDPKGRLFAGK